MTPLDDWYLACWDQLALHYGRPPSTRELARHVDRNVATVHDALDRLVAAGALVRDARGRCVRP